MANLRMTGGVERSQIDEFIVSPLRQDAHYYLATPVRPGLAVSRMVEFAVYDSYGGRYLDFTSGANTTPLGHLHPAVTAAAAEALKMCDSGGPYGRLLVPPQVAYAKALSAQFTPEGADRPHKVAFCVDEREAVLMALNLVACATPERPGMVGLARNSFVAPGMVELDCGDTPAPGFWDDKGVFVVELVHADASCDPVDAEWLQSMVSQAAEHSVAVVCDERYSAYGRMGMVSGQPKWGISADLTVLGGPGGGGLPFGAVVAAAHWFPPGFSANPAAGHPLVMACGNALLGALTAPVMANVSQAADELRRAVNELCDQFGDVVHHAWGGGLLVGLDLGDASAAAEFVGQCAARGLLVAQTPRAPRWVRLLPPLLATKDLIRTGIDVFSDVCLSPVRSTGKEAKG